MKTKDYWEELKKLVKKDNWDFDRIMLLLNRLNAMHEVGANCDDCKTIDEAIKNQISIEEWKCALING